MTDRRPKSAVSGVIVTSTEELGAGPMTHVTQAAAAAHGAHLAHLADLAEAASDESRRQQPMDGRDRRPLGATRADGASGRSGSSGRSTSSWWGHLMELFRGPGSVRRRLSVHTAVLCVLIACVTGIAVHGLVSQHDLAQREAGTLTPAISTNRKIVESIRDAQTDLRGYLLVSGSARSANASDTARYITPHTAARELATTSMNELDTLLARPDFAPAGQIESLRGLAAEQRAAASGWMQYADNLLDNPSAGPSQLSRVDALGHRVETANDRVGSQLDALGDQLHQAERDNLSDAARLVLLSGLSGVILAVLSGWGSIRALTEPLIALRNTVRRQRAGDTEAWADTRVGAVEVREVAEGVNALTVAHTRLVANQARSMDVLAGVTEIVRGIHGAADFDEALDRAGSGLGELLGAARVMVRILGDGPEFVAGSSWEPEAGSLPYDVPEDEWEELHELSVDLWVGDRRLVVDDVAAVGPRKEWVDDSGSPLVVGALCIAALGLGTRPMGVLSVRTSNPKRWTETEVSAVQQVAAELARHVVREEAARDRAEYVARLEELDAQKDTFLSTVSHELRTPLTSIAGYLEMLEDGDAGALTPQQQQLLDVVGRNAARLRALIEDLLVLNKLEATIHAAESPVVNVWELVRDTTEELLPVAHRGDVTLWSGWEPGSEVRGDAAQLARALANVMSNAIKFTPSGGQVRVYCRTTTDRQWVEITVVDTGVGIPTEEQGQLFQRFFRGSNATTSQVQGTGLGLAIMHGIVQRHGGRVEVESELGRGTTVRMILPHADNVTLEADQPGVATD